MRIELAALENGKGGFSHAYAPGELDLADERVTLLDPPTVTGEVRGHGQRAHLKGRVSGRLKLECDRCLKPVDSATMAKFSRVYVTTADYEAQQAVELSEDDLDLSVFDGAVIDIDLLVREELLLAAPVHVLCQKDCQGICPTCGVDRNETACDCETDGIDPRWAGLKELVNRK